MTLACPDSGASEVLIFSTQDTKLPLPRPENAGGAGRDVVRKALSWEYSRSKRHYLTHFQRV